MSVEGFFLVQTNWMFFEQVTRSWNKSNDPQSILRYHHWAKRILETRIYFFFFFNLLWERSDFNTNVEIKGWFAVCFWTAGTLVVVVDAAGFEARLGLMVLIVVRSAVRVWQHHFSSPSLFIADRLPRRGRHMSRHLSMPNATPMII